MANAVKRLAENGNLTFVLNMYKEILAEKAGSNVFFSPFSIAVALGMTHAGARNQTASEMKKAMQLEGFESEDELHQAFAAILDSLQPKHDQEPPFTLRTANRMYVEQSYALEESYIAALTQHYMSDVSKADFQKNAEQTKQEINNWVEEVTDHKITNFIPSGVLGPLTRLVLVNAIYFKGLWAKPFKPNATYDGEFHRSNGDTIQAKLMYKQADFPYAQNPELNCKIIQMDYNGDRLAMFIILPNEIDGINSVEKQLTPEVLKSILTTPMSVEKVSVALPKFKLEIGFNANEIMKKVGIKELFSPGEADLSGISPQKDLFVSTVLHKAFVEVNEQGTEAAAATAVVMRLTCCMPQNEFIADHPFIFTIFDKHSELILFMGRLCDPA